MQKIKHILLAIVALFTLSQFVTPASIANAQSFPDVNPTSESGIAIEKLYKLGIVSGRPGGLFAPTESITRAEAAKIMYGILELEPYTNDTGIQTFPDVPVSHWGYPFISTISDWKVMNGHTNGTFGPDDQLTRGQMAIILTNGLSLPAGPATLPFTDVPANEYYRDAVASLYASNITKGRSATTYVPNDYVTREELALFLDRSGILDELLDETDYFDLIDIAQVDGLVIDEVRFRQILTDLHDEIWLVLSTDVESEAYFDDETFTFENVPVGETIFEVNLNSYETPIYLKVFAEEDEEAEYQYQFKTPRTLGVEAAKMKGTAELAAILEKIALENSIDPDYFIHYITSHDNDEQHYFTHVSDYNYYFEFKNLIPFTLIFNTPNGEEEIAISPYPNGDSFDYSATVLN